MLVVSVMTTILMVPPIAPDCLVYDVAATIGGSIYTTVMAFHVVPSLLLLLLVVVHTSIASTMQNSTECNLGGFECVSAFRVRQCVDGMSQGAEIACKDGQICDAAAKFGPCVSVDLAPCCNEGIFPIPGFCHMYMICIHNGLRFFQYHGACAPGYEFNSIQRTCVPDMLANCSISLPYNNVVITGSTPAAIMQTTTMTTTTKDTSSTVPVCVTPGQIADPSSCRHYIVCSWASQTTLKASKVSCPNGLVFDTELQQCVFSTKCGLRAY